MFGDRPSLLNDPNHFVDIQKKGRKNLRHIFRLTIVRLRRRSVLNRRQRCESMTLLTNSFRLIISATTTTHSLSPLPAKLLKTRGSLIGWGLPDPTNGAARLQAASGPATVQTHSNQLSSIRSNPGSGSQARLHCPPS